MATGKINTVICDVALCDLHSPEQPGEQISALQTALAAAYPGSDIVVRPRPKHLGTTIVTLYMADEYARAKQLVSQFLATN